MLDLRHGTVVRTLIPKIAEGIFNVMCKFNEGTFTRTQTVLVYFRSLISLSRMNTTKSSTTV